MADARSLTGLLEETGWIHALARRLVRDPHLAADLAQDTALDALEARPDEGRPLRGWLATVMRNNLAKLRRSDERRRTREERSREPASEPDAAAVLERAVTHKNVVLAVLALEEPYRSTLLLRFFEQLSYDEIARRTGVTRVSVNSRVTRGLERLRQRLETTYGDRRALGLAIAPLAKLPVGSSASLATTTLFGVKTMHVAIGTAAATLFAATVSLGFSAGGDPAEPLAPRLLASEPLPLPAAPRGLDPARRTSEPAESRTERVPVTAAAPQEGRGQDSADTYWRSEVLDARVLAPTVETLRINTRAGDVELVDSPAGRLEVRALVRARKDAVPANRVTSVFADHVTLTEGEEVVEIEDAHKDERGWTVSFVVAVPGDLKVHANTGSGDVVLRRAQSEIFANTGSGDVRIEIPAGSPEKLLANTGSGDVRVDVAAIAGDLTVNTGSGDVEVRVRDARSAGSCTANTGSGDVRLRIPVDVEGTFELETHSGDVRVPPSLGLVVERTPGVSRVRGTTGSGEGVFRLSSGSGDLDVELENAPPPAPR